MASSDYKPEPESTKSGEAAIPPATPPLPHPRRVDYLAVDVALRFLVFASSLTAVLVMVTAKQTKMVPAPGLPIMVPVQAKFSDSPAFIYFIAALSVAGLYGMVTTVASISVTLKPGEHTAKWLLHFAIWDVVMLGIVASATGTAGGVAYIGLKGNSHVRWGKVCNVYGKFCRHLGGSIAVSLFASLLLLFLTILSLFSIYRRIPSRPR